MSKLNEEKLQDIASRLTDEKMDSVGIKKVDIGTREVLKSFLIYGMEAGAKLQMEEVSFVTEAMLGVLFDIVKNDFIITDKAKEMIHDILRVEELKEGDDGATGAV